MFYSPGVIKGERFVRSDEKPEYLQALLIHLLCPQNICLLT